MSQKFNIHIAYLIFSENESLSFINNYPNDHIQHRHIIRQILQLPKDVAEIYSAKENLIKERTTGFFDGYYIKFVSNSRDIESFLLKTKFIIVFSMKQVEYLYKNLIGSQFVLLSNELETTTDINLYNFRDIDINLFQSLFENILSKQEQNVKSQCAKLKEYTFNRNESSLFIGTDISINKNLYTISNLNILNSIRAKFTILNDYVFEEKNVELSINLINKVKSEIIHNVRNNEKEVSYSPFDYIISDLSNNLEFQINKKKYTNKKFIENDIESPEVLSESLKLVKSYDFKHADVGKENNLFQQYINEKEYIEQLISVFAASYVSPILKLSINDSKYVTLLKEIGSIDRSKNNKKINKSFLKLENQFNDDMADWLDWLKSDSSERLKLVSNLPLEWISHCGLPLMIKNDVSRIPVSPGYLTEKLLLDTEQLHLSTKAFEKILFISSFQDDDPIKNDVKENVKLMQEMLSEPLEQKIKDSLLNSFDHTKNKSINFSDNKVDIRIEWKNINNEDELVKVLNHNKSAMIIFDLHGGHNQDGEGFIALKGGNLHISSLLGRVKMPPIVILSACDTSPIDKNHQNVANMFLLAGAKTVLASALPILSREASMYIARLLVRLSIFLYQHTVEYNKSIRWSSFISGMTRQVYYTELLNKLEQNQLISNNQKLEIHFAINMHLNPLQLNFHEKILSEISKKSTISTNEIKLFIESNHKFAECLKYIQLGNPEHIVILQHNKKFVQQGG